KGCTKNHFRIDLRHTPGSSWNNAASLVFAKSYQREHPDTTASTEKIIKAFKTWMKHQRRKYLEYKADSGSYVGRHGTRGRRMWVLTIPFACSTGAHSFIQLLRRRLVAANAHPQLRRHVPFLKRLGVNGMSSDESDHRSGTTIKYRIVHPVWRDRGLTHFLHVFDIFYARDKVCAAGRPSKGNRPHERLHSAKVNQDAKPVPGLHKNCYSDAWYSDLGLWDQHILKAKKTNYNFQHEDDVMA
ncbi:hypothetical protein BOTBODRAFT_121833, partial [Botryobasidium botryosum FD-172 SS1]